MLFLCYAVSILMRQDLLGRSHVNNETPSSERTHQLARLGIATGSSLTFQPTKYRDRDEPSQSVPLHRSSTACLLVCKSFESEIARYDDTIILPLMEVL